MKRMNRGSDYNMWINRSKYRRHTAKQVMKQQHLQAEQLTADIKL